MSLNTDQKATQVYKKGKGKVDSNSLKRFYEEAIDSPNSVFAQNIFMQDDQIPATAPSTLGNEETLGVVKRYIDLILTQVPGSPDAYYHDDLKDAIPFNYGDGSYNYVLKNALDAIIAPGANDWEVDPIAGVVRFYAGAPASMPPKISFYKYVGEKGFTSGVSLYIEGDRLEQTADSSGTHTTTRIYITDIHTITDHDLEYLIFSEVTTTVGLRGSIHKIDSIGTDYLDVTGDAFSETPVDGDIIYVGKLIPDRLKDESRWTQNTYTANDITIYEEGMDIADADVIVGQKYRTLDQKYDVVDLEGEGRIVKEPVWQTGDAGGDTAVYSNSSAYSLTTTPALLDCGTDPKIILTKNGTYSIRARVLLKYQGATFASNQTITLKLRRTNNTPADIADSTTIITTEIVTTVTKSFMSVMLPEVMYQTDNIDDVIEAFGSIDVIPSAGSMDVVEVSIVAIKLNI